MSTAKKKSVAKKIRDPALAAIQAAARKATHATRRVGIPDIVPRRTEPRITSIPK